MQDGKVNLISETEESITKSGLDNCTAKIVPEMSVILSCTASIGKVAINEEKMATNQQFNSFDINQGFNSYYLANKFLTMKQKLETLGGSTTHNHLSIYLLDKVEIEKPPLTEQRKTATVLYTVDRAIEKTEEVIKQTRRVRQGLKQDLLTGQNQSTDYKYVHLEPVETEIPAEWDVVPLSDVTNNITEMPHHMPEKVEKGIPFITTGDISEDEDIDLDSVERISEGDYQELSQRFDAEKGDVLYTRYGTIGIAKEVDFNPKFIASYSVALLKPNQKVDPTFLTIQLNSWLSQKKAESRTTQSANKNFDLERIPKLNIVLPDKETQMDISRIISGVNGTISENEKYLQELKRLKRGLMQDLLSGTVRTTDTNIQVPDEIAQYG